MFSKEQLLYDTVLFVLNNSSVTDPNSISTIIYVADLYHLILYGRTIIDSIHGTKYYFIEKEDMKKIIDDVTDKKSKYEYLSESDRKSLIFAINREELSNDGGIWPVPKCFGLKIPKNEL